jgi:hypothetical protein
MALTSDYTWQLRDDGYVLNPDEITLDPPSVDIERVTGLDSAPLRESERDHEGAEGSFLDAYWEKGRSIILDGLAYASTDQIMPFLEQLKYNYRPSSDLVPFYMKLPGVEERVMFVKPRGVRYDLSSGVRVGAVPVQFSVFAEDPRIYSAGLQEYSLIQSSVTASGFGFPLEFPFGFGLAEESQVENLVNLGNRPTPVTFTIPGPTTDPEIVNEDTGQTLKVSIELTADQYLVIDTQYRTVRLNGTANRRGLLAEPNWFMLQPGDNHIRYRAATPGSSPAVARYRHAWR